MPYFLGPHEITPIGETAYRIYAKTHPDEIMLEDLDGTITLWKKQEAISGPAIEVHGIRYQFGRKVVDKYMSNPPPPRLYGR